MKSVEPPSRNIVLIGRNSCGQWVAQQQNGLFGGLFVNRADAVRYALFENGHHPESIIAAASPLELSMGDISSAAPALPTSADTVQRRVA